MLIYAGFGRKRQETALRTRLQQQANDSAAREEDWPEQGWHQVSHREAD